MGDRGDNRVTTCCHPQFPIDKPIIAKGDRMTATFENLRVRKERENIERGFSFMLSPCHQHPQFPIDKPKKGVTGCCHPLSPAVTNTKRGM